MRFFFSVESHAPLREHRRVNPTACHPNARTIRSLHTRQGRALRRAARWLHGGAFARDFMRREWHRDVGAVSLFPSSVSFPIPLVALFARCGLLDPCGVRFRVRRRLARIAPSDDDRSVRVDPSLRDGWAWRAVEAASARSVPQATCQTA
jgi:hypothetical protein